MTWVELSVNCEGFILKYRLRFVQNSLASSFFLVNLLMSNFAPLFELSAMVVSGGSGGGEGSLGGLGGSMIITSLFVGQKGSTSSIC